MSGEDDVETVVETEAPIKIESPKALSWLAARSVCCAAAVGCTLALLLPAALQLCRPPLAVRLRHAMASCHRPARDL